MLIILAGMVVGAILFLQGVGGISRRPVLGYTAPLVLGLSLGAIGGWIILSIVSIGVPPNPFTTTRTPLVAMQDSIDSVGTLIFTSGKMESELYYNYYIRRADGAIELRRTPTNDFVIFEDADDGAYLLIYHRRDKLGWWYLAGGEPAPGWVKGEFHVPSGTVVRNLRLDLN